MIAPVVALTSAKLISPWDTFPEGVEVRFDLLTGLRMALQDAITLAQDAYSITLPGL